MIASVHPIYRKPTLFECQHPPSGEGGNGRYSGPTGEKRLARPREGEHQMFGNFMKQAAVAISAMLTTLPALANDTSERAILVLDASGSMWGQVEGTPKITIARDVIQGLLNDWNSNVELGVTAYGHREKGNCSDIETLVPVGAVDGDQVMSAIGSLNPKGKTTLTDAVRQAAETLKYTEERATVLLVSDGKETCDADPCAAAAELEANGIDFTVHVVGFDLTDEEKEQLQCIADNTGGKFLSADNAPELHVAMEKTVQLVAEPEPEPEPAGPTGMKLKAVLAEGGEPVKAMFDIKKAEQDLEGKRELVDREYSKPGKPAIVQLPPGFYVVTATYGKAERSVEIAVEAGELVEQTIVVPAGHLRLQAALIEGGEPVEARFDVHHAKQDLEGKRKVVAREYGKPGKPALLRLAAGDYFVTASYGDAERSFDLAVEADTLTEETLIIPAGHLRLQAALTEQGDDVEARFDVYHAKQDLEGKRKIARREYGKPGKPALFRLAEGNYFVEASHGHAEQTFEIDVVAGELIEKTVVLGAGHLRLGAVLAEGGEPVRAHFEIREGAAADDDGRSPGIINLSGEQVTTELPAGRYHVVVRYGEAEVTDDIELKPGELTEETIVLDTGRLHVSAALTDAGEPIGATIRVLEPEPGPEGRHEMIAGRSSKPDQPVGFGLPAGDYRVMAIYGDAEVTGNVRVNAGEITEKVMAMNAGFLEIWGTRAEGGEPMKHIGVTVHEAKPGPDGKLVHVTGGVAKDYKNARFALAAGRYLVTANDTRRGEASVEVEVKPGEQTDLPIIVPVAE